MTAVLDKFRKLPDFTAFEAFARALWENEAAVMIGAGFSRMCARDFDAPVPPLWGDFATKMRADLGYSMDQGQDALRLAQEYQAQHGRNGLDRLIRELVTDNRWQPSFLHKQLLEFPWRDVLTTNWDTLLERTSPQTPDRIYGCVRTVRDIAHEDQPRIVKLHGSLPSHTPFIFTEDDFRTYPARFAPFVNLAQQVMLENELCLLGFSGNDPNFLQWSGWVRDTLDISARRIRLVGVLNLTPAGRSLLEARNVTPIDLAPLVREHVHPSQWHERALELLFSALIEAKPSSPFEWAISSERFNASTDASDAEKPTRRSIAEIWANDRGSYPGWIIAPNSATHKIRFSSSTIRNEAENPSDHLNFALQRIWRHTTARIWLHPKDLDEADRYFEDAGGALDPMDRIELCVHAATYFRIFRDWASWAKWLTRLQATPGKDAQLWHAYETGLKAMLEWDDDAVSLAADALESDTPIWMMRRASLLSALFRDKEAAELYEAALLSIRHMLQAAPKSAWLISLEAWASLFHRVTYDALRDAIIARVEDDSDETRLRYVGAKADPWEEISRLDRLSSERIERNREDVVEWKLLFQPGRYRPGGTRRIGGDNECPFYGLISLMERTGAPERSTYSNLFSDRLETAYRALKEPDEDDLMAFLARYRGSDKKILDSILPRMRVACLSDDAISKLLVDIPKRIDRMLEASKRRRPDDHLGFQLALLARVVIRADDKAAFEIFVWCLKVLNSPSLWWACYTTCEDILKNALEPMNYDERRKALDLALNLKLPVEANAGGSERDWPEIIESFSSEEMGNHTIQPDTSSRIDDLIAIAGRGQTLDRSRALLRLHRLHKAEKLTELQKAQLRDAVWRRCGDGGWPADTELHPWIFLELPGREQAEQLFESSFVEPVSIGEVNQYLLLNLRAGLSRLNRQINSELIVACVIQCLAWRPKPSDDDEVESFFSDTERLEKETANEIGFALAHALLPALTSEDLTPDLRERLDALPELKHIPTVSASAFQLARLRPERREDALAMIRAAIASRQPSRVYPSFIAIDQFVKAATAEGAVPSKIMDLLLNVVEQRIQPGLGNALKVLGDLQAGGVLSTELAQRIAAALPDILEEYAYDQDRLPVPSMAELPTVRQQVHRLSSLLKDKFPVLADVHSQLKLDPLPEVRDIRADPVE